MIVALSASDKSAIGFFDTMGAGDSFIAGFLYGILNGLNVQDSMEAGAQNSAVTIGYQGAW